MKRYLAVIWRNRRHKMFARLLRRPINSFAKEVICRAYEMQIIDSRQLHELAAIIDRSLYSEYYRSPSVDERGESTPPPADNKCESKPASPI